MNRGSFGAVIGALYQKDKIDDQPAQAIQDGQAWGDSQAGRTQGEDTTSAIYGELGVPLLKDVPFADKLQFTRLGGTTTTLAGSFTASMRTSKTIGEVVA